MVGGKTFGRRHLLKILRSVDLGLVKWELRGGVAGKGWLRVRIVFMSLKGKPHGWVLSSDNTCYCFF